MKFINTQRLAAAFCCSVILAGCQSVPQRSAGDTFRLAIKKSFEKDTNYNFSMTQQISLIPTENAKNNSKITIEDAGYTALNQDSHKATDCDRAFDAAVAAKLSDAGMTRAEKKYVQCLKSAQTAPKSPLKELSNKKRAKDIKAAMTPARINAINEYWFKPTTLFLNGAVDAKSKRIFMDYGFSYKPQNFTFAINFPMLLDFNKMSIALDPSLALPFLGPIFDQDIGTSWHGKWINFTLPAEFKDEIPTEILLGSFMKALQLSYDGVDDKYLSYATGKMKSEFGARQAVKLRMPPKQQILLFDRLMTNWVAEVEKAAQETPEAIKNPKQFNQFLGMAKEMTKDGLFSSGALGELAENDDMLAFLGDTDYTFYLNGNQRILGMLADQKLTAFANMFNADINSRAVMKVFNHNRADFSVVPTGDDMIDGNALIAKFAKGEIDNPFKKSSNTSSEDAADAAEDTTSSSVANEDAEQCIIEAVEEAVANGTLSIELEKRISDTCYETHGAAAGALSDADIAVTAKNATQPAMSTNKSAACAARIMTDKQGNPLTDREMDKLCENEDVAAKETLSDANQILEVQPATATIDDAPAPTALMIEPKATTPTQIDDAQRKESHRAFCRTNPRYAKSKTCRDILPKLDMVPHDMLADM